MVDSGDCVFIGLLMGGMIPLVRITSLLHGDLVLDYCHMNRYRGGMAGGEVQWLRKPVQSLAGRTVVLVDDIFDEGITLAALRADCLASGAARVLVTVLAKKLHTRRQTDLQPDFIGLTVDDRYVFGCGMDLYGRWRHLPAIYALD